MHNGTHKKFLVERETRRIEYAHRTFYEKFDLVLCVRYTERRSNTAATEEGTNELVHMRIQAASCIDVCMEHVERDRDRGERELLKMN